MGPSQVACTVRAMDFEVVRSARRRKTVQAREVDGVLRIQIPAAMTGDEEQRWVDEMTRRFRRRAGTREVDLASRARTLGQRYGLPIPSSIRWADNQRSRWGSCTVATGAIRVSSALGAYPRWVLDYVVVHELAHLVHPDHGAAFWGLVDRYPRAERARGFLIAKGIEPDA